MHINQFDEELISIFLEPLVSFNKNTNVFEAHFEKTTNLNQRYLHEIMTTPRFKDVLNMKQPTFVSLMHVYLKKFKHGIGIEFGDEHYNHIRWEIGTCCAGI